MNCSICENCKCIDEKCQQKCNDKLGHPGMHICNHKHQCKELCDLNPFTNDCKGRCVLEYNHKEKHNCGVEIHHCKENCYLAGKTKNCGEKCIYPYPHEGKDHFCEKTHFCINKCKYIEKSKGCNEECKLEYGHEGIDLCDGKHYCIEDCNLKGKSRNCGEKCILEHPHEGMEHSCGNIHYCIIKCDYFEKSEGCEEKCTRKYGHKEIHLCNGKHICKEKCYLKDKAKNCGEKCKLEYPHDGKEHNCNNEHKCEKKCSLIDKSINCKKNCCLVYGHNNECKCDLSEDHICNQPCKINVNCKYQCSLIAGHLGNHLCGKCTCPEFCKYENCSSNCNRHCILTGGHEKKEHLCEIKAHKCKFDCCYKNNAKNCYKKCRTILEIEPNHNENSSHFCEILKEDHGCSGTCYLYKDSRNCQKDCILEVNHHGEHLCKNPLEKHLCKEKCYLKEKSKECREDCNELARHRGSHKCSLNYEEHICKKKCNYYVEPRQLCNEDCTLQAEHGGECICQKPKNQHICNGDCEFKVITNGCKQYCNLPLDHKGRHNCGIKVHFCKNECSLYGKTKTKNECLKNCCLPYKHFGICKCGEERHLCDQKCKLNQAKECKAECNKFFGHTGEHLCEVSKEKHICQEKCYYYNKFIQINNEKAKCNEFCSLSFEHDGKHICKQPYNHPCDKKCCLFGQSNGCNEDCSLEYLHEGEHICTVKKNLHTCKKKCKLCEHECGHAYNHDNTNNLICNKCNKNVCILSRKQHLCGAQHDCMIDCSIQGYCVIEGFVKQEDRIYRSQSGEEIHYTIKFQEIKKKKCSIKIKENEFSHSGEHKCESEMHKCGFQCIQCGYYCIEKFGHDGLHKCFHGSIKDSFISISDSNDAFVKKDNTYYKFKEGETAIAFFCDEYCKEQGQGHIHLIKSEKKINNEDTKFICQESNYYIYECKCSYFWDNILRFKGQFTNEEQTKFSLCNWQCKNLSHNIREFCQLPLWHEGVDIIPKGVVGSWISKGHVLKCQHPSAAHTIFLIDQSGSMRNSSIKPTEPEFKNKMNNMLGAAIEALLNYCKKRNTINPKDKCSLIGYESKATKFFDNISISEFDRIKEFCFNNLKPSGGTHFLNAFKEAKKILDNINRNEYIPVIILLTDGLDAESENTINYLKNDVSKFDINNII